METTKINPQDLSIDELKAVLAEKEKEEKEARQLAKTTYEKNRDYFIKRVIAQATELNGMLVKFKNELHTAFDEHQKRLNEYGEIRSNSKGGFSITSSDGLYRAKRLRSTQPNWDERSTKAIELISDFLRDTVKKRDQKLFDILITFIQRNEKGELEYSKVMHLLQHKAKYDDARWVEGLTLIQESYNVQLKGYSYEFQVCDQETGKWQKIEINFTAI